MTEALLFARGRSHVAPGVLAVLIGLPSSLWCAAPTRVTGEVLEDATSRPLPARVYIQAKDGRWYFPTSAVPQGSAIRYERRNWINTNAVEMHTTVSAHPFMVDLPPGVYTITVERGPEYRPIQRWIEVEAEPLRLKLPLHRWINMAAEGWYSGDVHVHRDPTELSNVMLAEDVNVAWPMVYWTTRDTVPPSQSPKNIAGNFTNRPVRVDGTHYYYPRNTEYEIFETGGRRHTLGALLVGNHKTVFDVPAVPVSRVAERARAEGALLDLDKHNWDWSIAVVPIVKPDLFELANNHHWRTTYSITNWAVQAPAWMGIGTGTEDERAWTLYGFHTYYALLNCGFRIKPSAGTANGVHPVPLGFGRVYVQVDGTFNYNSWVRGLAAGRSFVTTGPMLLSRVNGEWAGRVIRLNSGERRRITIEGSAVGVQPVEQVEVILNGEVVLRLKPRLERTKNRAWESPFREVISVDRPGWVAVRCWESLDGGRQRFAHSAPTWIEVKDQEVRPSKQEASWLAERTREELARSRALLSAEAVREYEQALQFYEKLVPPATPTP